MWPDGGPDGTLTTGRRGCHHGRVSTARPEGLLSNGFELVEDTGEVTASLDGSFWSGEGTVVVDGREWSMERRFRGGVELLDGDQVVASARRQGFLSARWSVAYDDRVLTLAKAGLFGRTYSVDAEPGGSVGEVRPNGMFSRGAAVTLPPDMPAHIQVLVVALVMAEWRRSSSAASSAGAGSTG